MAEFLPNGFALGLQAAQFNRTQKVHEQEAESRIAENRIRERLLAQQIEEIQRKAQIDEEQRKAFAAAVAGFEQDLREQNFIPIEKGGQGALQLNPNKVSPEEAALRRFPPALRTPEAIGPFISNLERAKAAQAKTVIDEARLKSVEGVNSARADLLKSQLKALEEGKKNKPTDFEANVNFINDQLQKAGKGPLTNAEFMDMAKRHMGILPKASAAGQWFDRTRVNALMKEHSELQKEINDLQTSTPPRTKSQREQQAQSIAAKLARQVKVDDELEKMRDRIEKEMKGDTSQPSQNSDKEIILEDARNAIKAGAPRDKVIERLRNLGINEEP